MLKYTEGIDSSLPFSVAQRVAQGVIVLNRCERPRAPFGALCSILLPLGSARIAALLVRRCA